MSINKISKNFIKALQAKECILFIGSGVSKWAGLPDWDGLLRKLLEFLSDRGLDEKERSEIYDIIQQGDLITAASLCRYKMRGSDLRDFIDEIFINSKPRPQEIHKILVNLGPDSFITTNYDRLIEEAYQKEHDGLVLAPVNNDQAVEQAAIIKHGSSRFIFTPHGRMDEVETIIFSREDYRKIQFGSKSSTNCLEHLFVSRPVVYIGFSLKDPDFLMIKDQIASTYSCYEREHFAILPDISEIMKQFWRDKYGINIISYETILYFPSFSP
jgi:SIR2-like domain